MGQTKSKLLNYLIFSCKYDVQTTKVSELYYPVFNKKLYSDDDIHLYEKKCLLLHYLQQTDNLWQGRVVAINNVFTINGFEELQKKFEQIDLEKKELKKITIEEEVKN
jgi:hypothetical protein